MGCIVRLIVLLLLAVVALAAVVAMGVPGVDAALRAAGWSAANDAITGQVGAILLAIGEGFAHALGRGWNLVASAPWDAVPGAAAHLVGQLTARLGDLAGSATRWGFGAIDAAREQIARLTTTLTRTPSGEPLGPGRLAVYAVGWLLVLGLIAVWLLRRLARWLGGVWRCATANRPQRRRGASTARS